MLGTQWETHAAYMHEQVMFDVRFLLELVLKHEHLWQLLSCFIDSKYVLSYKYTHKFCAFLFFQEKILCDGW